MVCGDGNSPWTVLSNAIATSPLVLNWGQMGPPVNTCQSLKTSFAVTNGREGATSIWGAKARDAAKHRWCTGQLHHKEFSGPKCQWPQGKESLQLSIGDVATETGGCHFLFYLILINLILTFRIKKCNRLKLTKLGFQFKQPCAAIENVHKYKIKVLFPQQFHLKEWKLFKEKRDSEAQSWEQRSINKSTGAVAPEALGLMSRHQWGQHRRKSWNAPFYNRGQLTLAGSPPPFLCTAVLASSGSALVSIWKAKDK